MSIKYSKVIVIGNGSLLISCLKYLKTICELPLLCVEPEKNELTNLRTVCKRLDVEYMLISKKSEVNNMFDNISMNTLVLSIHNSHIFTSETIDNGFNRIVNFHNSLLPMHPGRNSPTWAIFDLDKVAGVTWHEVTLGVDKGNIILQKSIPLNDSMTGISLTKDCVKLGYDAFKEILDGLLEDTYISHPQLKDDDFKMHYSFDVPNNGVFDLTWPIGKMSAFLRSLDYGPLKVFAKSKVMYGGIVRDIDSYQISSLENDSILSPTDSCVAFNDEHTRVTIKLSENTY